MTLRTRACSGGAQEIDRLVNGDAQHPATRVLSNHSIDGSRRFVKLHELIAAADMDLARMTYVECAGVARLLLTQRRRDARTDRRAARSRRAARR